MKEKLLKEIEKKKREDEECEMIGFTGMPKIRYFATCLQWIHMLILVHQSLLISVIEYVPELCIRVSFIEFGR